MSSVSGASASPLHPFSSSQKPRAAQPLLSPEEEKARDCFRKIMDSNVQFVASLIPPLPMEQEARVTGFQEGPAKPLPMVWE